MPVRCRRQPPRLHGHRRVAQQGQALVETALVLPLALLLAFGVVGVGRITRAQMGVRAVAREAARVAAVAETPGEAGFRGIARGQDVAAGFGLTNGSLNLEIDTGMMLRGDRVRARVRYEVTLDDLPLLGWVRVPLESEQLERVDLYRSRWADTATP